MKHLQSQSTGKLEDTSVSDILYSPDHFLMRAVVANCIVLLAMLIDTFIIWRFLEDVFRESRTTRLWTTIGLVFLQDVVPVYLTYALKKNYRRAARVPTWLIVVPSIVYIAGVSLLFASRWSALDQVEIMSLDAVNTGQLPMILMQVMLPIATTCVSVLSIWLSYEPYQTKIRKLERAKLMLTERVSHGKAKIKAFETYPVDTETLTEQQDIICAKELQQLIRDGDFLKAYSRLKNIEYQTDPAAVSAITASGHRQSEPEIMRGLRGFL